VARRRRARRTGGIQRRALLRPYLHLPVPGLRLRLRLRLHDLEPRSACAQMRLLCAWGQDSQDLRGRSGQEGCRGGRRERLVGLAAGWWRWGLLLLVRGTRIGSVRRVRSGGRWRGFSLVVCGGRGREGGRGGQEGGTVLRWGGRNPSSLSLSLFGAIRISRTKLKGFLMGAEGLRLQVPRPKKDKYAELGRALGSR
jgi:hypothetical protein